MPVNHTPPQSSQRQVNDDDVASITGYETSCFGGETNTTACQYRQEVKDMRQTWLEWKNEWSTVTGPWREAVLQNETVDDICDELRQAVDRVDEGRFELLKRAQTLESSLLTEVSREANRRKIVRPAYDNFRKFRREMKLRMSTKYVIIDETAGHNGSTDDDPTMTSTEVTGSQPIIPPITISRTGQTLSANTRSRRQSISPAGKRSLSPFVGYRVTGNTAYETTMETPR